LKLPRPARGPPVLEIAMKDRMLAQKLFACLLLLSLAVLVKGAAPHVDPASVSPAACARCTLYNSHSHKKILIVSDFCRLLKTINNMGRAVKITQEFLAELESGIQGICHNTQSAYIGLLTRTGDQIKVRVPLYQSHISGIVFRFDEDMGKHVAEELTAKQLAVSMNDAIKRKSNRMRHDDLEVNLSVVYADSIEGDRFNDTIRHGLCEVAKVIRDWYTRYQERCFSCINFEYPERLPFKLKVEPRAIQSYLSSAGISAEELFDKGLQSVSDIEVVFTRVGGNLKGKPNESGNRPMVISTSVVWIEPPKGGKKRKEVEPPTPES